MRKWIVRGSGESVADDAMTPGATVAAMEIVAFSILLIAIVVVPLPYGAVLPGGKFLIEILAFSAAALALAGRPSVSLGVVTIPVAALLLVAVLGAVQIVPLTPGALRAISPASAKVYDDTNSVLRLFDRPPTVSRISIAPGETRSTILLTLAYAALFGCAAVLCSTRLRRRIVFGVLLGASALHVLVAAAVGGGTERIHGTFVNPDHFAGYLEIAAALAFGLIWTEV